MCIGFALNTRAGLTSHRSCEPRPIKEKSYIFVAEVQSECEHVLIHYPFDYECGFLIAVLLRVGHDLAGTGPVCVHFSRGGVGQHW